MISMLTATAPVLYVTNALASMEENGIIAKDASVYEAIAILQKDPDQFLQKITPLESSREPILSSTGALYWFHSGIMVNLPWQNGYVRTYAPVFEEVMRPISKSHPFDPAINHDYLSKLSMSLALGAPILEEKEQNMSWSDFFGWNVVVYSFGYQ